MKLACLLMLPLAACVSADRTIVEAPSQPGVTPDQIVAARQSAFHLSAVAFGSMKPAVESGGDVKPLTFPARGLVKWARTLPSLFPDGTNPPSSKAKPELWTNRADFEAKAAAYLASATRLAELAQAGDKAAFGTQWAAVRQSCESCHAAYRAEPAR